MSHGIEADHKGLFGLCVFGAENSTDKEILSIFEEFGPVVTWNRVNNLVFIRYSTLEEAVQCYTDMEGHSQFNVKAARKKNGDKSDNQRRDRFGDQNEGGSRNRTSQNVQSTTLRPMPNLKFDVPESEFVAPTESKVYHRVILAHLHPHIKQSDIYNLCTKADGPPAHVDMETFTRPPYSPEYYAIVHVTSEASVRNIVRGLNNLRINGYQLVVAPYEKLVEEGMQTNQFR